MGASLNLTPPPYVFTLKHALVLGTVTPGWEAVINCLSSDGRRETGYRNGSVSSELCRCSLWRWVTPASSWSEEQNRMWLCCEQTEIFELLYISLISPDFLRRRRRRRTEEGGGGRREGGQPKKLRADDAVDWLRLERVLFSLYSSGRSWAAAHSDFLTFIETAYKSADEKHPLLLLWCFQSTTILTTNVQWADLHWRVDPGDVWILYMHAHLSVYVRGGRLVHKSNTSSG